jgi:hypothetical protein
LCIWHALIGVFWSDKDYANTLDKWLLGFFAIILIIFNVIVAFKFYLSLNSVNKLKKKETKFLELLLNQKRNELNLNFVTTNNYNIRL